MSEPITQNRSAEWLNCLQANGYRLTATRRVVVETLASSQRILSPLDVYDSARERYPGLGLVTVYRTIEKLEELGLLQRVHQPSGCHGFISAFSGHQHLLICQECGCSSSGYALTASMMMLVNNCLRTHINSKGTQHIACKNKHRAP
jgi:Fe2+ or Zn2+ uptake regulation protein